jgi:uncharacterized protein
MKIVEHKTAQNFLTATKMWLLRNEGVNAVALGIAANLASDSPNYDEYYFASFESEGNVIGTAMMTPPFPININSDDIGMISEFVNYAKQIPPPSGVLGPGNFAKEFADKWCLESGCKIGTEEAQAIHELKSVNHPPNVGEIIVATEEHAELLNEWGAAFCVDCDMKKDLPRVPAGTINAIKNKSRYLLLIDGVPVTMAAKARETENGGTINYVYTPSKHRKNGYASVIVANLSQQILDSGKESVYLYTQLSNLTSNKVYYNLGYRVISDSWCIQFEY